jgi:hypothetical protein
MLIPRVYFLESFSPADTDTSIKTMIGLCQYLRKNDTNNKWKLEMFDAEAAFCNTDLDQEMYIELPEGKKDVVLIIKMDRKTHCIQLTKEIYGNINSRLSWMKTFTKSLTKEHKIIQSNTDL